MPLLQTIIGNETNNDANVKVFLFHSPLPDQKGLNETHLYQVARTYPQIARTSGIQTKSPAVEGLTEIMGGEWTQQNYEVSEGQVLKIYSARKVAWRTAPKTGCLFIRMRGNGPLTKVSALLIGSPRSRLKTADFVGRFDVLTLDDAKKRGVRVNPAFEHMFHPVALQETFRTLILEAQIAPDAGVKESLVITEAGETVVLRTRTRTRLLE